MSIIIRPKIDRPYKDIFLHKYKIKYITYTQGCFLHIPWNNNFTHNNLHRVEIKQTILHIYIFNLSYMSF